MTLQQKLTLRAQHTCVKKMSSLRCSACNSGVPYPELTIAEMIEQMKRARGK